MVVVVEVLACPLTGLGAVGPSSRGSECRVALPVELDLRSTPDCCRPRQSEAAAAAPSRNGDPSCRSLTSLSPVPRRRVFSAGITAYVCAPIEIWSTRCTVGNRTRPGQHDVQSRCTEMRVVAGCGASGVEDRWKRGRRLGVAGKRALCRDEAVTDARYRTREAMGRVTKGEGIAGTVGIARWDERMEDGWAGRRLFWHWASQKAVVVLSLQRGRQSAITKMGKSLERAPGWFGPMRRRWCSGGAAVHLVTTDGDGDGGGTQSSWGGTWLLAIHG